MQIYLTVPAQKTKGKRSTLALNKKTPKVKEVDKPE